MSALDELIYDRTQTDVTYAAELNRKLGRGEALTAQELADWNAGLKGAYNATDMNRVDAAVRELGGLLTAAGYPVQYVDPKQPEPEPEDEDIILTSTDFQAGAYLYTTGEFRAGYANYVCTKSKIKLATGKSIVVRTDLTLLQYSGFVWYDANKKFIANTFPSSSQGEAPIQWNGNFQAIPPENAVYCDIDINSSNITPAKVGTVYVRQIANPESAGLPEEYTQVEYIESHGTEYIDTGFKPDNNTRIILDVYLNAVVDGAEAAIFGARTAADSNGFYMFQEVSETGNYNDGYGGTHSKDISASGTGRHIIDKNKNKTYIDNDLMHTYSQTTFQAPVTLCIMAVNRASGVDERFGAIKLYSCKIYDDNAIVRCYIPCANTAGIVGLYDTVSGSFFGNANSGAVEPVDLPTGYTQVEYIQSSGTQYIDTGYKPNSNTRVVCKVFGMDTSHGSQAVFGARTSTSSTDKFVFLVTDDKYYRTDYGNNNAQFSTSINFSGDFVIDKNKNVTILNESNQLSNTAFSFNSSLNLFLFASNTGGTANVFANGMGLKYCKIYDNGTLVRDFIPCKNSSGAIGLYDIVGNQFYANAGTGSFAAGANVSEGFTHGDVVPRPPARDYWVVGDIINLPVWVQYIQNVRSIIEEYYTMADTPSLPKPTAPLNFNGANAIEKLIYDVRVLYNAMSASYRKCGTFQAGVNVKRLPLQRSVT